MYQLFPPFLFVKEETNFSDSWEVFCCKLLNLHNNTSEIIRRLPPENGVDLYFPKQKIAYQCKSVESGLTAGFNLTKIKESYKSALKIKTSLGWDKYVVCINIELTGAQQKSLSKELPEVTVLTRSFWVTLCEKYSVSVQDNFRKVVPIHRQTIEKSILGNFSEHYSSKLKKQLDTNPFDIIFYSNRHNTVYKVPVSGEFQVGDLIDIFVKFFDLPEPKIFDNGMQVSLSYAILYEDQPLPLHKTLQQAGLSEHCLITFWLQIRCLTGGKKAESFTMQYITFETLNRKTPSAEDAVQDYKSIVTNKFVAIDELLLGNQALD